jgi:hypothetical protein
MIRIKLERRKDFRADCPKPNNQKSTQPRQQNENQTQKKNTPPNPRPDGVQDRYKQIS